MTSVLDGSVGDLSIIISYFKCQTTKIKPPFAAEGDGDKIAEFPPGIMIGASVSAIFLLTILFCIFKKQKARSCPVNKLNNQIDIIQHIFLYNICNI